MSFEMAMFYSPYSKSVSPIVQGTWERPLQELIAESQAFGMGNDPFDLFTHFVGWCFRQDPPVGRFSLLSVPGVPWYEDEGADWWEWFDRFHVEIYKGDSAVILADVDSFMITRNGDVVWPPGSTKVPFRPMCAVPPRGEPFPTAWLGCGTFGGRRERGGTYTGYPLESVPPIRVTLEGSFEWLRALPDVRRPLGTPTDEHVGRIRRLLEATQELPAAFVTFFRSPELWRKIDSATDCYLRCEFAPVPIRGEGRGRLVRFLHDSQDCAAWSLHLPDFGAGHRVVTTHEYFCPESETSVGFKPHPRDIVTCAASFEEFVYRFWIENALIFALYRGESLPPGGEEYLTHYSAP